MSPTKATVKVMVKSRTSSFAHNRSGSERASPRLQGRCLINARDHGRSTRRSTGIFSPHFKAVLEQVRIPQGITPGRILADNDTGQITTHGLDVKNLFTVRNGKDAVHVRLWDRRLGVGGYEWAAIRPGRVA